MTDSEIAEAVRVLTEFAELGQQMMEDGLAWDSTLDDREVVEQAERYKRDLAVLRSLTQWLPAIAASERRLERDRRALYEGKRILDKAMTAHLGRHGDPLFTAISLAFAALPNVSDGSVPMEAIAESERDTARVTAENRKLRELLWLRHHGTTAPLYGDDGHRDCNACLIDFKHDTAEQIEARFWVIASAALSSTEAGP